MRRGCVSLGELNCDGCQKPIPYPDRYLAIDETNGKEDEEGETKRYCIDCAMTKGYAHYKEEKGDKILTFF
jgi:hypothetical protein